LFLDFEKIVPLGEPNEDWYEQHWNEWGTKWNAVDCIIEDYDEYIIVWFETAWSPPIPIMKALTKQHKGLSFHMEYNEGGVGFRGVFESQDGEVIRDDCRDMTEDDFKELGFIDEEENAE
jgi:hypothetical protein